MMKNSSVLSPKLFFFILVSLKKTRQCICSPICFALTIIDPKMIPGELLGPTDLPGAQTLRIHEAAWVVVIDEHENFVLATF